MKRSQSLSKRGVVTGCSRWSRGFNKSETCHIHYLEASNCFQSSGFRAQPRFCLFQIRQWWSCLFPLQTAYTNFELTMRLSGDILGFVYNCCFIYWLRWRVPFIFMAYYFHVRQTCWTLLTTVLKDILWLYGKCDHAGDEVKSCKD